MVCPKCKAEYSDDVARCPACGASLEDSTESSGSSPARDTVDDTEELYLVPVWSGDDPSEFAAVKAALERSEIPFLDESREGYFLFPSFFSKMQVRVASSDLARADRVVRETLENPAPANSSALTEAGAPAPEPGEPSEGAGGDAADHPPEEIGGKEAVREVWQGGDESLATTISDCLRENGIALRGITEEDFFRVLVRTRDEERAKEIIREIIEGGQ